jgi:hypothetical protein
MKMLAMPATEVLLNSEGYIEIVQKDSMGEDDTVVYFPAELGHKIARAIEALALEHADLKR